MQRKTLDASRLQAEISRRIHRLQEVIDDGVKIGVPRPQLQAPDSSGCNWTIRHFGNAVGFEAPIAGVIAKVQAEYNLAMHAKPAVDPFGESKPSAASNPFGDSADPVARADPFGSPGEADIAGRAASGKGPLDPFAKD